MSAVHPFQRFQRDFALHVRDPRAHPRPAGVSARRMALYDELLFNNLVGFIDACFPITRSLLGERRWRRLGRRFFAEWRSQTPWFHEIPREFLRWLTESGIAQPLPPYLPELAHYEWVELAVDVMDVAIAPGRIDGAGDLMQGRPVLNPALMNLAYRWPVQRIGLSYRPRKPQAVNLVVFRDTGDAVRFLEINTVAARLLDLLAPGTLSGSQACMKIAAELAHPDPPQVIVHGHRLLADLACEQAILGVWK